MSNPKVKYIMFRSGMSTAFYFYDGMLLISDAIPEKRKLEIIKKYL